MQMRILFRIIFAISILVCIAYLIYFKKFDSVGFFDNSKINLLPFKAQSIKRWIIVTSISAPTNQCKALSEIPGFKLLVIGDIKTNDSWHLKNAQFLSIDNQKNLGFRSYYSTPFNSYTRKNIGYLYAIKNGAQFIYDTDDDNAPTIDLESYFNFDKFYTGLVYDHSVTDRIINPYAHFGQPLIWPRGFPLDEIKNTYNNSYLLGAIKTSIVQQGVVNGDPDIDAIFRLTKKLKNEQIDIYFDESAPSFQIPLYKMSPYNSQNTLISYNGFWSLYLPNSVSFRLTDIWRSYWAQRLMWLLNETVSFNGPNAYQLRNAHSYFKDFEQENSMYLKTKDLIDFLFEWKCAHSQFYDCMIQLSTDMAQRDFWAESEIKSMKKWIFDLKSVGYKEPKIVNFENKHTTHFIRFNYHLGNFNFTRVRYSPEFQTPIELINYNKNASFTATEMAESFSYFEKMCKQHGINLTHANKKIPKRENYSIIVTFNHEPIVENIIILSHLYRNRFRNLIFCGTKLIDKLNFAQQETKKFDHFTFIEIFNSFRGSYHYFCMNKAIEMGYKTQGFLLLSDDVFLKHWNLRKLNVKNIWFPVDLILKIDPNKPLKDWGHSIKGFPNLLKTWKNMEEIANDKFSSKKEKKIIENYFKTIDQNQHLSSTNKLRKIKKCGSDIFYVPERKFSDFLFLSGMFRKFDTFLEIAVPNILAGIERNNNVQIIKGRYVWNGAPLNFNAYDSYEVFFHPFKLSKLNNGYVGRNYCKLYLRDVFMIN